MCKAQERPDVEVSCSGPREIIFFGGQLLCIFVRSRPTPSSTTFFTSPELGLQVGKIVYSSGGEVRPHRHMLLERTILGTPEVLFVEKGRMTLDLYNENARLLYSQEMSAGDVAVLLAGGHGIRFHEETVILEIKQGPYAGAEDKVFLSK